MYQNLRCFSSFRCLRFPTVVLFNCMKKPPDTIIIKYSSIMNAENCLRELGYAFNEAGQLRKLTQAGQLTDEPFEFNVSDQHQECQDHYEKLGDVITNYVYYLLESQLHLMRLPVPKDSAPGSGTFVFVSKDYDVKDTLLLLIHGSGVVRAGQWARSLIINDSLDAGTQIPYIKKGLERDFGVVVFNTNDNLRNGKKIPSCGAAEDHARCVWEEYVQKTRAKSVALVAHSYGGVVTLSLYHQNKKDFNKRVKAVAFTDSVHGFSKFKIDDFMRKISQNWVSSSEKLDTPMKTPDNDIIRVSAGHPRHEMTSTACINSVFEFIDKKCL